MGAAATEAITPFVGDIETKTGAFPSDQEAEVPRRMSQCHSPGIGLEIQALPPHPAAAATKGLWIMRLHRHR
uniref:Uncharacterized protein n=1 Tax=Oryctolagus cuniculus TaxID=9986 RepID=A0A5F9CPA7_RABIT